MPHKSIQVTSAIPKGLERPVQKDRRVDLLEVIQLLFRHLTSTLCQTVYQEVRTTERERKWTFEAVVRFWTAMIIRHPPSLGSGVELFQFLNILDQLTYDSIIPFHFLNAFLSSPEHPSSELLVRLRDPSSLCGVP